MKVKTLLYSTGSVATIICATVLVNIANVANINNTYAEDVNYDVNIAPSINITIPTDTVTLNLTPTSSASFNSTNLSVTVGTNNPTGYTLTMAPSDATSTSLTRTGGTETIPTLATLAGGYTEQTFTTNRWGYKLSSSNYLPFTTSNEINVTDGPSNDSTNTVTFAAKADMSQTSGAYILEIAFTAVANYVAPPAHTIADGGNMQDVSSVANGGCPSTLTTGQTYTLTDSRDGEVYTVARLADGNCWLLENLRLDLTNSTVINNTTADNTNASTVALSYLKNGGGTTSNQWPTEGLSGANWPTSPYDWSYSVPYLRTGGNYHIYPYDEDDYDSDEDGQYIYSDMRTTNNITSKIGIFYNYCAASAGTYCWGDGRSSTGSPTQDPKPGSYYDIDGDICPAGWHMPTTTSGNAETDASKFYQAYNNTNDRISAIRLIASGWSDHYSARAFGQNGNFWSSTYGYNEVMAGIGNEGIQFNTFTIFHIGDGEVYFNFNRDLGHSVRCVLN